jgi:hypothetical protein
LASWIPLSERYVADLAAGVRKDEEFPPPCGALKARRGRVLFSAAASARDKRCVRLEEYEQLTDAVRRLLILADDIRAERRDSQLLARPRRPGLRSPAPADARAIWQLIMNLNAAARSSTRLMESRHLAREPLPVCRLAGHA